MSLHNAIMNLPCNVPKGYAPGMADEAVYKIGHRDARHAAAELALKADAEIAQHKQTLTHMAGHVADLTVMVDGQSAEIDKLRAALTRVCSQFPSDTDLVDAGWDAVSLHTACDAYDAGMAALANTGDAK